MENITNALQKKIIEARSYLTKEAREAIDSVDWKSVILKMNDRYNEDQLDTLETETELLLCGLTIPDNYPKELENRMTIPKGQVDLLINELDESIFKKIQENLIQKVEKYRKFEENFGQNDLLGLAMAAAKKKGGKMFVQGATPIVKEVMNESEKLEKEKKYLNEKYMNPVDVKINVDKKIEEIKEKINTVKSELEKINIEKENLTKEKLNLGNVTEMDVTRKAKISSDLELLDKQTMELEIKKVELPASLFKAFIEQKEVERAIQLKKSS